MWEAKAHKINLYSFISIYPDYKLAFEVVLYILIRMSGSLTTILQKIKIYPV